MNKKEGSDTYMNNGKKLRKSSTDKKIFGVCGGIAEYFGIDSTIVRIIWTILAFIWGSGVILYFIVALIMPDATD